VALVIAREPLCVSGAEVVALAGGDDRVDDGRRVDRA
jgi:hypothetical protein